MVDTSIIECIREIGGIGTYTSWMWPVTRVGVDQSIIQSLERTLINNRIYCQIRREPITFINSHTFDLYNDDHHILLSGGTELGNDALGPTVGYHETFKIITPSRVSLRVPSPLPPSQLLPNHPPQPLRACHYKNCTKDVELKKFVTDIHKVV